MFKNVFQKGFISVFYSIGSKPLQLWESKNQDGTVEIVTDEEIESKVLDLSNSNISQTYISCPPDLRTLGIKLPYLVLVVKNLKKYFSFEIHILDDKGTKRRFRCSNFQAKPRVKPYICTMPLVMEDGWNYLQLDLASWVKTVYGTNYAETQRIVINANCYLRRVYFAEKLMNEDELPPEMRIYKPVH
jgi:hypothetical protein